MIPSVIKYLPVIYLNHNRNQIFSYINNYFLINHNKYNFYIYEANKKYYEIRKKIFSK